MKESPTSNDNFKIEQVQTQSQILNQEEYVMPIETREKNENNQTIKAYSSPRYTHTYSVMSHDKED